MSTNAFRRSSRDADHDLSPGSRQLAIAASIPPARAGQRDRHGVAVRNAARKQRGSRRGFEDRPGQVASTGAVIAR